eukprot:COSAG04_NODE_3785_length_2534_cov_1.593429_1_plen_259_part_10
MLAVAAAALVGVTTAAAAASSATINHQGPVADMDQLHDLMRDPERVRQLVPPEIMERFGGAPEWMSQTAEEREGDLRQHVRTETARADRRLQWMWEDTDKQGRGDSLAAQLPAPAPGSTSCDDALAANAGQQATCEYDCDILRQEYFPDDLTARCFIYDPSTQTWPAELLDMRQQRLETQTFVGLVDGTNQAGDIEFSVREGRTCTDITIASTFMDTGETHIETVCLVDGQHEYNHTITAEHSVEVVGYAESGVHEGAG